MCTLDTSKGFHEMKKFGFSRTAQDSQEIARSLDRLIEMTYAAAPMRQPRRDREDLYCLRRIPSTPSDDCEHRDERAICSQWGKDRTPAERFLPGLCDHIQAEQVPLKEYDSDKGWSEIDLLGVSPQLLPVVLELKIAHMKKDEEAKDESPLRMLVEGLAYAIGVKRAWNEGHFRTAWQEVVDPRVTMPKDLAEVPIVGIAPNEYWDRRMGKAGRRGILSRQDWYALGKLVEGLAQKGFPVHFVQYQKGELSEDGLPRIDHIVDISEEVASLKPEPK